MSNKFVLSWWVSLFGAAAFVVAGVIFAYSGFGVPSHPRVKGLIGSVDLAVRSIGTGITTNANGPSSKSKLGDASTVTTAVHGLLASSPALIEVQSSAPVINYSQRSDDLTRIATGDSKVTSTTIAATDGTTVPTGSAPKTPIVRGKDKVSSKSSSTHRSDLGGTNKSESRISIGKNSWNVLSDSTTTTLSTITKIGKGKGKGRDVKETRDD